MERFTLSETSGVCINLFSFRNRRASVFKLYQRLSLNERSEKTKAGRYQLNFLSTASCNIEVPFRGYWPDRRMSNNRSNLFALGKNIYTGPLT